MSVVETRVIRSIPDEREEPAMTEKGVDRLEGVGRLSVEWQLMLAIIREGTRRENEAPLFCPADIDLATLIFGGSVIAAMGEPYPILEPRSRLKPGDIIVGVFYGPKELWLNLRVPVWNELYEAWRRKPGSLDSRFCETMLKLLYPTSYSERRESWRKSTFEEIWLGLPRIIGDALAPPLIKDDRGEFVSQLPEGVKQSLGAVVAHVPQMVGLVVDWMR